MTFLLLMITWKPARSFYWVAASSSSSSLENCSSLGSSSNFYCFYAVLIDYSTSYYRSSYSAVKDCASGLFCDRSVLTVFWLWELPAGLISLLPAIAELAPCGFSIMNLLRISCPFLALIALFLSFELLFDEKVSYFLAMRVKSGPSSSHWIGAISSKSRPASSPMPVNSSSSST